VRPLELPRIRTTSPTLAETMRACFLRAGLSRSVGGSRFVLGNPKAWLGTAYHEVLNEIAELDVGQEALDAVVERLWNEAIASLEHRANVHPLDRRFDSPTAWPGYYLARASVALRAKCLSAGPRIATAPNAKQTSRLGLNSSIREQDFAACDGKLLGRPDVIRANEVIDYKSGAIMEYDEATQNDVVKIAYIRQLRIYGYLVKEKLGWWPSRGILLPLAGAGIEVALDPIECAREATEAVALLDAYNGKLIAGAAPEEFASPSSQVCRWCPYKILCPAFWQNAVPEWSGQLDGAAVEGVLAEAPTVIHGGAARAVALDIQAGSEARRRAQIAPLNPAVHSDVDTLVAGDRVRLIGLRVRRDGILIPRDRTVMCRVDDIPILTRSSQV